MSTRWCHNAKTGDIFSYKVSDDLTDFPRGVFLAYQDYLTTGLKSEDEAKEWAENHGVCNKCKDSCLSKDGNCFMCGNQLEFKEVKIL